MTVISGVLKGPMGDARVGVVIELRAVKTSATVVNQARSQSVTNATGHYSLNVEPGAYDVMITASGRQPERVGGIQVMVNSAAGTLNDFLSIPGETDLNPAIVETVDNMRAEAAKSAASAKADAAIASAAVTDTLNTATTVTQTVASAVEFKKNITSTGDQQMRAAENTPNVLLRFRDEHDVETGALYAQTDTGVMNIRWGGTAFVIQGRSDGFVTMPKGTITASALSTPAAVSGAVTTIGTAPLTFRGADAANFDVPNNYSIGTPNGFSIVTTYPDSSAVTQGKPAFYVNARSGITYSLNGFGGKLLNFTADSEFYDWIKNANTGSQFFRNIGIGSTAAPAFSCGILSKVADSHMAIVGNYSTGVSQVIVTTGNATASRTHSLWTDKNTTVDANGFIKKASPIVKLFSDGNCELNDQSQGVTTERISEGVYRISGTLGFNADAEWGGVDGGIEIPTDRNKLPLVWVDYEVDETGDLLIKTFHRINATAPKFAQNVKAGYEEGQPIDIPVGRWIDLRVEMPGVEEPEFIPQPEPEVTPDSGEESATE
ncbi:phage tail fiber protein [Serratia aquatilis]|uniref:Prophage tail fiber N-terminal domain-containing protein n=1 Tax=Serratia aquatilis TaxID=1737515 RepID=A0ABV6EGN7_9GAMM